MFQIEFAGWHMGRQGGGEAGANLWNFWSESEFPCGPLKLSISPLKLCFPGSVLSLRTSLLPRELRAPPVGCFHATVLAGPEASNIIMKHICSADFTYCAFYYICYYCGVLVWLSYKYVSLLDTLRLHALQSCMRERPATRELALASPCAEASAARC